MRGPRMIKGAPAISTDQISAHLSEYSTQILRYFLRRLDNADDAAEALSDVFLIAWQKRRHAPADGEAARAWLYAIAQNVLLNRFRTSGRARKLAQRLAAELATQERVTLDFTAVVAESDRVGRALAELEPEAAELIRLVHWDGLNLVQAATVLGIPASTARSRYQTAKGRIRETLVRESAAAQTQ